MNLKTKLFAISLLTSSLNVNANVGLDEIKVIKGRVDNIIQSTSDSSTISEGNELSDGIILSKKQKEVFADLKTDLLYNMQNYSVVGGDTIADIAKRFGLNDYHDLVLINSLLGNDLKTRKNNPDSVLIKPSDDLFVPKNDKIEIVIQNLDLLREIKKVLDLNNKIGSGMTQELLDSMSENIYPSEVQSIGIEKMLKGFIEAQKQEFDPYLPHIVDIRWQETVSCANLIRTLLAFSVDKDKLTDKERLFFQKQGLDAWILPEALKNIGYVQTHNLMDNFSLSLIGGQNPIPSDKQENYEYEMIKLGKYLEKQGVVGSILPLYFRYSHYKGVVAEHNRYRKDKHYNTHQTVLAGIDSISFDAKNVGFINDLGVIEFGKNDQMTVFDYLTNFIQQRGDYGQSALADWQKKLVQKNLIKFQDLINLKINGTQIDLSAEFNKDNSEMIKVKPSDKIEFSGPIMIDGLHMVNSSDPDKVKNMNARTRFYFEFIIIGNFLPSELLEPKKGVLGVGASDSRIIGDLETKGVYALKIGDTVESAIKTKIVQYEKDSFDKLDKLDPSYEKKYKNLLNYFYSLQIKALKISGYMQSESDINPQSFNINAPIPYFSSSNINTVFKDYITVKKKKIKLPQTDILVMKSFIQVTTLPGDSYKSVINRIRDEIYFHANFNGDQVPNLQLFSSFNELQQRKFLAQYIKYSYKSQLINPKDFMNGKISEGVDMIINLDKIDKIIHDISVETHSPDLQLSSVDEFVIDLVSPISQNNNILENILNLENYTPTGSYGLKRLVKQVLEYNPYLQFNFHIFGMKIRSEINSYGDYQLRLYNLYRGLDEEWPNREQLLKAFSYFETNQFKDYVGNIENPYIGKIENEVFKPLLNYLYNPNKSRIEHDLDIVRKIKFLIISYDSQTEDVKKIYLSTIISDLQKILLLDNGSGNNVVGKIIGTSLLNDKINLHFQKLNGILQATGEKIEDIYDNPSKMGSYEKLVTLINNLGETVVVYGLAENYLMRNFENIETVLGNKYDFPKMQKTLILGQFIYGPNTFKKDLLVYKDILGQVIRDVNGIYNPSNEEHVQIKVIIDELISIINGLLIDEGSTCSIEKIYDLFKNKKIKEGLSILNKSDTNSLNTSIIPLETEFSGNDFRDSFFRYINTRDIKREGPGFISKIIPRFNG